MKYKRLMRQGFNISYIFFKNLEPGTDICADCPNKIENFSAIAVGIFLCFTDNLQS